MSTNTVLASAPLTTTGFHIKATGTTLGNSLIWDNGTNVGIGNTNTSYTLDVSGTGRFTGNVNIDGEILTIGGTSNNAIINNIASVRINIDSNNNDTGESFTVGHNQTGIDNNNVLFRVQENGNVGIGTSTFTYSSAGRGYLAINGTSDSILEFKVNDTASSYLISTTTQLEINANGSRAIQFNTNANERMRINSGGNIGIGTAGQAAVKLEVKGDGTTSSFLSCLFTDSASQDLFYVRCDGLIATGTRAGSPYNNTTANAVNMRVDGGGILLRSTASSQRFKENIKDWDASGLDMILALKPKIFKYKKDYYDKADVDFLGLIAEEVAEVSTYLADYENEDRTGQVENVRYANIVVPLIKAIQEMNTKLDEQNQTIQSLQEQINILAK